MGPHDVVQQYEDDGWTVLCACGAEFTRDNQTRALAAHEVHFNIERARAALRGEAS